MQKRRIWFNHWFSSAYFLINLIKDGDKDRYHVLGSNENAFSVMKLACDEWYREDSLDDGYAEFCLHFCRTHNVDVFVPRKGLQYICGHAQAFADIGTKLFTPNNRDLTLALNDKEKTYKLISEICPECIPPYEVIRSAEEFEEAYSKMEFYSNIVCMKDVVDEGAKSFRKIHRNKPQDIAAADHGHDTYEGALRLIARHNFEMPVILMPYLDRPEVSVDCLRTANENIIIPRFKMGSRVEEIRYDHEIVDICEKILSSTKLTMPCNIQFRFMDNKPYLLEINTRMSGGLHLSCLAANVNIPSIAMHQLYDTDNELKIVRETKRVAYIETPVIIE